MIIDPYRHAAGGGGGGGAAVDAAINALNPLSYWTLRDLDYTDYGSLGINLSVTSGSEPTVVGPDGDYRQGTGVTGQGLVAGDSISYEPLNASGLTLVFFYKPATTTNTVDQWPVMKQDAATSSGTWAILLDDAGFAFAMTRTSGGSTARFRSVSGAWTPSTDWQRLAFRYGGTATSHPGVRVNGSNLTGSTGGSGSTTSDSTGSVRLFANGASGGTADGGLAHVAIFAGQLSDADLATIEDAATTDGW